MQDLRRSSSARSARPPTSPRTSPRLPIRPKGSAKSTCFQWIEATERAISAAKQSKLRAASIREQSVMSQKKEQQIRNANANKVRQQLRKQVRDGQTLLCKLTDASEFLRNEVNAMQATLDKTQTMWDKILIPLELADRRLVLLEQRPFAERVGDRVEEWLAVERRAIRRAMDQMTSIANIMETHLTAMKDLQMLLSEDLRAKEESLKLDQACLRLGVGGDGLSILESVHHLDWGQLYGSPEIWHKDNQQRLEQANEMGKTAVNMRRSILKILKDIDLSQQQANYAVTDAIQNKVDASNEVCAMLEAHLKEARDEVALLEANQEATEENLEEVLASLALVQDRMSLRNMKPKSEMLRDKVEVSMHSQAQTLQASADAYHAKLLEIESQRRGLLRAVDQMTTDFKHKSNIRATNLHFLEMGCPHVDGNSEIHLPHPPPRAVPGMSSSDACRRKAAAIDQAIQTLAYSRVPRAMRDQ